MKSSYVVISLLALCPPVLADEVPNSAALRMNQIQVIGTHNSYHGQPEEPVFSQLKAVYPDAATWDYAHRPLDEQLESGVRSFELDLYQNTEGIRVFHVPKFDQNSTCETFIDCATVLRDWSRAHPKHVPIIVLLELKEDEIPGANMPVYPFDAAALEQLEKETLSVFDVKHLIRPDDVRGDEATLKAAIQKKGWPSLDDVRGRIMFVLHTGGKVAAAYTDGHPALEGRVLFLQAHGDEDYAAVYVKNNPRDTELTGLVQAGYIVRTRADSNLKEAQANDMSRRDAAMASGAQIITTDFPEGEAEKTTGYVVAFDDGAVARVNVVNGN